jgi:WD40 repeat protein
LATGKEQRTFGPLDGNQVTLMAISPDSKWLVTAAAKKGINPQQVGQHDRFLRLWDLEQGMQVRTLDFPEDKGVQSLRFTPDSRTVVAGIRVFRSGWQGAVRTWDVASGKPGRVWTDDPALGLITAVSPDGKELATLNEDGVIRFWDMTTGAERRVVDASPCSLEAVCFQADGKTLLTVGRDGALRAWDAATGRLLGPPRVHVKGKYPSFAAGGKLVMTYFYKGNASTVLLQDAATGKVLLEQEGHAGVVSPDGKRFAIYQKGPKVFDIATGKLIQTPALQEKEQTSDRLLPWAFSPDGLSLITVEATVSVWDVHTGKRKSSWNLFENKVLEKPPDKKQVPSWERIESLALSPDGRSIAFALLKNKEAPKKGSRPEWFSRIALYEVATGKLFFQDDVEGDSFRTIAFSPDGKLLAAGGTWTVPVWDTATGKLLRTLEGHRGRVTSLAFSADGRRLASASEDSTVLVWDVSR